MMLRRTATVVLLVAAAGGWIAYLTGAYSNAGTPMLSHTVVEHVIEKAWAKNGTPGHARCNNGHDMPEIKGARYNCSAVTDAWPHITFLHVATVVIGGPGGWRLTRR